MDKETAPREENTKLPVWLAKKYSCTVRSLWDCDAGVWESPGPPFPSQYEGSPWLGFFKSMHKPQPIPGELCLVDSCECVCVCVPTCVCTYVHMHEQAHLCVLVCAYVYFPNSFCIIGIFLLKSVLFLFLSYVEYVGDWLNRFSHGLLNHKKLYIDWNPKVVTIQFFSCLFDGHTMNIIYSGKNNFENMFMKCKYLWLL